MFGNGSFHRVRDMFGDQFEPDGGGYLYRKSMKGAPIRVSADERDRFIATFNRQLRHAIWFLLAAVVLLIGLCVALLPDADSPASQRTSYVGMICIVALFMVPYYRAWGAPARELERRPAVGLARTRSEVRRAMLARMSYGQLGFVVVAMIAALFRLAQDVDVLHGWGTLWLVCGAIGIVAMGIQVFRKWRSGRE